MDIISFLFLMFSSFIALPLSIVCTVQGRRVRNTARVFCIMIPIIGIVLSVTAIIMSILGLSFSGYYSHSYKYDGQWYYYTYFYRSPLAWVALGIGSGALAVAIASAIMLFTIRGYQARNGVSASNTRRPLPSNRPSNLSYIEAIKQLKELFDSGAITLEEFNELKRKEIDGR